MYGADPRLVEWGTKSGCRRCSPKRGSTIRLGDENLHTLDDVARRAWSSMRAQRPADAAVIVKLNEGVSGAGNALVDLAGLPAPGGR